ncbi:Uncharacterized protein HZ326_23315 [Fusarium oxysporum f. sp. albedinis]|nr:Uncharacterized protein HZ326_26085 [Fusarium oxysporum f. sp. albedinis]KAJ0133622.1 Uncharacterized protein HZ326_23315 [Fusarium oxysporum f. sp. albedinis]
MITHRKVRSKESNYVLKYHTKRMLLPYSIHVQSRVSSLSYANSYPTCRGSAHVDITVSPPRSDFITLCREELGNVHSCIVFTCYFLFIAPTPKAIVMMVHATCDT